MGLYKVKGLSKFSGSHVFLGKEQHKMVPIKYSKNLNVPNLLSVFRIFMIIPFVVSFLKDNYVLSIIILLISGITDMLDGFIARKMNQITKLGAVLDPLADKLTLISVIVCLSFKFSYLIPFVGILLVKDLSMIVVGGVFLLNKISPPPAKWYGKFSTAMFYFSVVTLVFFRKICEVECKELSLVLFSITTIFMIFSLIRYFVLCLNLIKS